MFYEPYDKKKKGRGRAPEPEVTRRGCLGRLVWFGCKLLFKLAILALVLAVIAYALPPGLFLVEPESDLSIQANLPDSRVNVLLLGVDMLREGAQRSDTIIICSIGYRSVKLVSVLRDTVVDIPGYGRSRVNAAYAHGGAELAMKTINENFGLNISKYAVADYMTLAKFVDAVGGVELVISEEELAHINYNTRAVFDDAASEEAMGYEIAPMTEYSKDGETPVRLNGVQALGYARIRKLDSDFVRTYRQRKILGAALESFRKNLWKPWTYSRLFELLNYMDTNLGIVEMLSLGTKAVAGGGVDQLRVPVEGSYTDSGSTIEIDSAANRQAIYDFLYG